MNILYSIKKRQTSILRLFLVIVFGLTSLAAQAKENTILVTPTKIEYYDFYDKFTAIGQCKSEQSKTYYAKTNGTIDSISIIQGKNVAAGDVLVTINEDIAKANKSKAEAVLKSAQETYERDLALLKKKIISSEALNKSEVMLKTAKSDLVNMTNQYEDMIITAPYDGYVGVVKARHGDDIKKGDYLFSLIAKGEKTVFIELPEIMHSKIDKNSLISTQGSNNSKIQGRVVAVSDYLNDNGTITAKLAFPDDSNLLHGSYIEVEMIFNQHNALSIPEKTLLKNNIGNFVYKITEDNKVKQVYITTGTRTNNMIEIISDELQLGDSVILSGLTKVYNGATITTTSEPKEKQQNTK